MRDVQRRPPPAHPALGHALHDLRPNLPGQTLGPVVHKAHLRATLSPEVAPELPVAATATNREAQTLILVRVAELKR
jgi:hypothetical protein